MGASEKLIPSKKNTLCRQAWHNLHIAPAGDIRPCCVSQTSYGKFKDKTPLSQFLDSPKANHIRSLQANGVWPEECKSCQIKEKMGSVSDRLFDQKPIEPNSKNIKTLDIAVGNICQLDCVMCNSESSSKWGESYKKIASDVSSIYGQAKTGWGNFHLKPEDVARFSPILNKLEKVELKGGEPFISPFVIPFLQEWIKKNTNAELLIFTSTHGLSPQLLTLLAKVKNLNLYLSVDGTGQTYEWIRGVSWEKTKENILLLHKTQLNIRIAPTIQFTNFFNMKSLLNFCNEYSIPSTFKNFLGGPHFLKFSHIPKELQFETLESIKSCQNFDVNDCKLWENIIHSSKVEDPEKLAFTKLWIDSWQKLRSVDFYQTSPHYQEIFKLL